MEMQIQMILVSPSVAVAGGEAHEAIRELVLVDKGTELAAEVRRIAHSAVPVSDNGLSYERGEVVIVVPADTFHGNGDVGGGQGVVSDSHLGSNKVGLLLLGCGDGLRSRCRRLCGNVAKVLLREVDKLLMSCLLYTSPSPRDGLLSRMPSSA